MWEQANLLRSFRVDTPITSATISDNGDQVVVGGSNVLEIWDLQSGTSRSFLDWLPRKFQELKFDINSISISPSGNYFVTTSDGAVTKSTRREGSCQSGSGISLSCSWGSGSSKQTVNGVVTYWRQGKNTYTRKGKTLVWDFNTGEQLGELKGNSNNFLTQYYKQEKKLLTLSSTTGQVFSTQNSELLDEFDTLINPNNECNQKISFYPDKNQLATSFNFDGKLDILIQNIDNKSVQYLKNYDASDIDRKNLIEQRITSSQIAQANSGSSIWPLRPSFLAPHFKPEGENSCITVSPRGDFLAATGSKSVYVWGLTSKQLLRQFPAGDSRDSLKTPGSEYTYLAFSPDGRTLATAHANGEITLWNLRSGTLIKKIKNSSSKKILHLRFSPDGKSFISVAIDGQINIWGH